MLKLLVETIAIIRFDVGINFVNGGVKRINNIRTIGNIGHRLLKGEGSG
jgi:hypothetical protein